MPDRWSTLKPLARDLAAFALLAAGATRVSRAARGRLTIATFHRVLPDDLLREYPLREIAVSVAEFRWFVECLARFYTCGTLAEVHRRWLAGENPGRPFLAITFDDGQRDGFDHARLVLEAAGVPGSFFVPTDAVDRNETLWHDRMAYATTRLVASDRRNAADILGVDAEDDHSLLLLAMERAKRLSPGERLALVARVEAVAGGATRPAWDGLMGWEELRVLVRRGHEVGSHSTSHPILPLVDDTQLEEEVLGSRKRLEERLGIPCETFCYPNGDHDDRVVAAVRKAGYLRAVTTNWGPNVRGSDPYRLTRCDIEAKRFRDRSGTLSEARLALRLSPFFPRGRR